MKERYKIVTVINGEAAIFKRWGESETEVRQDLENFIRQTFETSSFQIVEVEKDKTKTIKSEE